MEPLQHGHYYHIYNRGNNGENLFQTDENYRHFLKLYEKYIYPITETYAWVLMKNHFHLLVRIKDPQDLPGFENLAGLKKGGLNPSKQFSNLFNAYTKAFNKRYKRTGSLFEKPFHRKPVTTDQYFRQLIKYIHTNPIHHGFTSDFKDYPWSSYGSILSLKPTKLSRDKVIGWFDDKANFIAIHNQINDFKEIQDLIIE